MVHWHRKSRRGEFFLLLCGRRKKEEEKPKHNIFHFPLMRNTFIDYFSLTGGCKKKLEKGAAALWIRWALLLVSSSSRWRKRKKVARVPKLHRLSKWQHFSLLCQKNNRAAQYSAFLVLSIPLLPPMMELFLFFLSISLWQM